MFDWLIELDRALTLLLNGSGSSFVDGIAMTATHTSTWLPLFAVLVYLVSLRDVYTLVAVGLCVILCVLLCDAFVSSCIKPVVARPRPTHDMELSALIHVVNGYRGGAYGFFSSHAANTAAVATLHSLLFRKKGFAIYMYIWVLLNCWTRVYLGVHYVGDLVVGFFWGVLVGSAVCGLLRRVAPSVATGLRSVRCTAPMGYVMWLTWVYIIVRAALFVSE